MEGIMVDSFEEEIRALLRDNTLYFDKRRNDNLICLDNVDFFVAESQENYAVYQVNVYPCDDDPGNYMLWDKVGQGVGNLKSLSVLKICLNDSFDD